MRVCRMGFIWHDKSIFDMIQYRQRDSVYYAIGTDQSAHRYSLISAFIFLCPKMCCNGSDVTSTVAVHSCNVADVVNERFF